MLATQALFWAGCLTALVAGQALPGPGNNPPATPAATAAPVVTAAPATPAATAAPATPAATPAATPVATPAATAAATPAATTPAAAGPTPAATKGPTVVPIVYPPPPPSGLVAVRAVFDIVGPSIWPANVNNAYTLVKTTSDTLAIITASNININSYTQIPASGSMLYQGVDTPNQGAEVTMEINTGAVANVATVASDLAQTVTNGGYQGLTVTGHEANLLYNGIPTSSVVLKSATQAALTVAFSCTNGAFQGTCLTTPATNTTSDSGFSREKAIITVATVASVLGLLLLGVGAYAAWRKCCPGIFTKPEPPGPAPEPQSPAKVEPFYRQPNLAPEAAAAAAATGTVVIEALPPEGALAPTGKPMRKVASQERLAEHDVQMNFPSFGAPARTYRASGTRRLSTGPAQPRTSYTEGPLGAGLGQGQGQGQGQQPRASYTEAPGQPRPITSYTENLGPNTGGRGTLGRSMRDEGSQQDYPPV